MIETTRGSRWKFSNNENKEREKNKGVFWIPSWRNELEIKLGFYIPSSGLSTYICHVCFIRRQTAEAFYVA